MSEGLLYPLDRPYRWFSFIYFIFSFLELSHILKYPLDHLLVKISFSCWLWVPRRLLLVKAVRFVLFWFGIPFSLILHVSLFISDWSVSLLVSLCFSLWNHVLIFLRTVMFKYFMFKLCFCFCSLNSFCYLEIWIFGELLFPLSPVCQLA